MKDFVIEMTEKQKKLAYKNIRNATEVAIALCKENILIDYSEDASVIKTLKNHGFSAELTLYIAYKVILNKSGKKIKKGVFLEGIRTLGSYLEDTTEHERKINYQHIHVLLFPLAHVSD